MSYDICDFVDLSIIVIGEREVGSPFGSRKEGATGVVQGLQVTSFPEW